MTFREAYHIFCEFRRGVLVYDNEIADAMRVYMDRLDDLIGENAELSVDLSRTKMELRKQRKLKEKYYKELKDIYGLGCAGKE